MRVMFVGLAGLLASCDFEQAAPPTPTQLPDKMCQDAKTALDALRKAAAIEYNDQGEATIGQEVWLPMKPEQRDQLAVALAVNASCAAGQTSSDQRILIRGDSGMVLMDRIVSTTPNLMDLVNGESGDPG